MASPTAARPLLIGHRGSGRSHDRPGNPHVENTCASATAAHAAGADWVEIDVVVSADGDLFVHHDHTLFAFGDPRPVWQVPSTVMAAYGLETLDEFEAGLPAAMGIYVEAKVVPGDAHPSMGPGSLIALRDWMIARLLRRPMLWASFDSYALSIAQEAGLPVALITDADRYFISAITSAALGRIPTVVVHGDSLRQSPELMDAAFATAAACGVAVWTWDTPVHLIATQSRLGVTGFCVDEVAAAALELDGLLGEALRVDAPLVDEVTADLVEVLVG